MKSVVEALSLLRSLQLQLRAQLTRAVEYTDSISAEIYKLIPNKHPGYDIKLQVMEVEVPIR